MQRHSARYARIALVGLAAVAVCLLGLFVPSVLHHRKLDVVLKIEYGSKNAALLCEDVDSSGRIYALEHARQRYLIHAYDQAGNTLWQKELPKDSGHGQVLVSFPSGRSEYAILPGSEWGNGMLCVTVTDIGKVQWSRVGVDTIDPVHVYNAILTEKSVYAIGHVSDTINVNPRVIKYSGKGLKLWAKTEGLDGDFSQIALDRSGNLIAAGLIGAGMGTYVAKYSPSGHRQWAKETVVNDGGTTAWLGTDTKGSVLTIARLHDMIDTPDGLDESGRNQDYTLITYSADGKLVRERVLSHGAALRIVDAAIDDDGDIYVLGNRESDDSAVLTKYDQQGKTAWSGAVKLPAKCTAGSILLDGKDGIYIRGSGAQFQGVRAFIYKVRDRR